MEGLNILQKFNKIIDEEIAEKGYSIIDFYKWYEVVDDPEYTDNILSEDAFRKLIKKYQTQKLNLEAQQNQIISSSNSKKQSLRKKRTLRTIPLVKGDLNDKDVKVIINKPIYDSKAKQYFYKVETPGENWVVQRTYSEFEELHNKLDSIYPKPIVPKIPKNPKKPTEAAMIKRTKYLQKMFDFILQNEVIKARFFFNSFLKNQSYSIIQINSISIKKTIEKVNDLFWINGEVTVSSSSESEWNTILKYIEVAPSIYQRINTNLKSLYSQINTVTNTLNIIHNDIQELNNINKTVFIKEDCISCFDKLSEFSKKWSEILKKQNDLIKYHVKDFLKCLSYQVIPLAAIYHSGDKIRNKYKKNKKALDEEKLHTYMKKNPTKWKVEEPVDRARLCSDKEYALSKIYPIETRELQQLYDLTELEDTNLFEMTQLLSNCQCKAFIANYNEFFEKFYPTITQSIDFFSEMQFFLGELEEKRNK